jgi:poly-gamma-glutamate synthesis protein (capsule biosynthesis protein)
MSEAIRLLLAGDIDLGGGYADRHGSDPGDWIAPFTEVQPVFAGADVRVGNLECPLFRGAEPRRKRNVLGAPPDSAAALSYLGFTALSLANNHSTDQGSEGLQRTREVLQSRGIVPFGAAGDLKLASTPAFVQAKGVTFAFLGYAEQGGDVGAEGATHSTAGCVPLSLERIQHDIAQARARAEHVVVSLHWGYQSDRYPDPEQVATARKVIDLGALIVHGHHPHVLQGMERYGRGLILYSLGNFYFPDFVRTDGLRFRFPRETRRTAVVLCDITAPGVQSFSTIPLVVGGDGRVRLLRGRAAARAARSITGLARRIDAPDYAARWRTHHDRTERRRRRQEAILQARSEIAGIWRRARSRGVAGLLRDLRGRHAAEVLRVVRRFARLYRG